MLAHSIDWIGNNKVLVPQDKGDMLLLLCPDFAHKIARDGLDVAEVQRMLLEWTRTPIERWHRSYWPKLEERGYVDGDVVPLAATPGAVPDRRRRRRVRPSRALLLHLRPHLVGERAVRGGRRLRGREVCELPDRPG